MKINAREAANKRISQAACDKCVTLCPPPTPPTRLAPYALLPRLGLNDPRRRIVTCISSIRDSERPTQQPGCVISVLSRTARAQYGTSARKKKNHRNETLCEKRTSTILVYARQRNPHLVGEASPDCPTRGSGTCRDFSPSPR